MTDKAIMASSSDAKNADIFKQKMSDISAAAIGVVLVRTREPYRVQEILHVWSISVEVDFKVWTILNGWQNFPMPDSKTGECDTLDLIHPINTDNVCDPVKAFDKVESDLPENVCAVFLNVQHALQNPAFQQHIKIQVRRALSSRQCIVVLIVPESTEIPPPIEDDLYIVEFDPPSHSELKTLYTNMLEDNILADYRPKFSEDEVDLIIQNALGMTDHEFDTALALSFVALKDRLETDIDSVTTKDFIDIIMKSKVAIIKKTDILELHSQAEMSDVGGLDLYKKWVFDRKVAFSKEARAFGIGPPKGVLILGPPGGGKSLVAKATAQELGIPCITFDIGKVFGQFVGQSELRMRQALKMIDSLAPAVVLVDEIDKGLGGMGGGGDSGTSSRVFGTFLTWMQERENDKTPVFVVMTANNITGLPPELMRRGRLDEIFAVTFPSMSERKEILKIHMAKRGHGKDLTDAKLDRVASVTSEFVGAELESIVKDSLITVFNAGGKKLTSDVMCEHANKIIPLSKAFSERVHAMNEWAKNNARPASTGMSFEGVPAKKFSGRRRLHTGKRNLVDKIKPVQDASDN